MASVAMHLRGTLTSSRFASGCLEGNRLGDPTERDVWIYVPPGHDGGPRLPTVMVLPGFGATHRSMLGFSPWEPNLVERFERLLDAGACAPAILVLPDAMNRWGGSQFVDSAGTGRYQTYLAEEVVAHVDARYPTIPEREARAVVGRSSGGFGALRLGMDRPEIFSVLGSHAGDAAFEVSMRPMLTSAAIAIDRDGGLPAFAERIARTGPRGQSDFDGVFVLAASAAYSPDPDGPAPWAALPFDPRTAALRPEVWSRWLRHDPVVRLPDATDALRTMRHVFLDAGDRDEHGLQFAARVLADGLRDLGVPVTHQEYDGGHRHTSYRYDESLPILVAALAR